MSRAPVTLAVSGLAALGVALAPALRAAVVAPAPGPVAPAPAAPAVAPPESAPVADAGPVHARVTLDREVVYLGGDRRLDLRVDLAADGVGGPRLPTDLLVVFDRSGSMAGSKLDDAKRATVALLGELGAEDRFALVSFASGATVDRPLGFRPLAKALGWDDSVRTLRAEGGTDMAAGLRAAVGVIGREAGRSPRVVLVSDGQPDSAYGLQELAADFARREIPVTTVGIGDDYDETLMRRLADAGTGNFHWARPGQPLHGVFADELATAREVVASQVVLDLPDGVALTDAGGLPTAPGGEVALGQLFGGQERVVWLSVVVPADAGETWDPGELAVRFRGVDGGARVAVADVPAVGTTREFARMAGALGAGWERSVVEHDWNAARLEVAAALRDGDQGRAQAVLSDYRDRNALLNGYANSQRVADNLAEVDALSAQVAQQFVGDDQVERRNLFAKQTCKDGYDALRVGQTKANPVAAP